MRTNFKIKYGIPLYKAGYSIVPIKSGEKDPRTRGWQKIRATESDIHKWARSSYYGGLGVLGEFNPAIDIDVHDELIVNKLCEWVFENIGSAPVRTGNPPRVLIPCSTPKGGLGPQMSAKFKSKDGDTHQVEIKAHGQQWVAYGVHPNTKKPYTWEGGELHEVDADFLPVLTPDKIDALFEYFEGLAPSEWDRIQDAGGKVRRGGIDPVNGEPVNDGAFENYTPPLNIDKDKILSILDTLDPDKSEKDWRTVGMSLFHQFEGKAEGKEIFIEWSRRSVNFDLDEIENRWPSWEPDTYHGKPVTFATTINMYNEVLEKKTKTDPTLRRKAKNLSDWENRFAIVELPDGTDVHDAGVPIHLSLKRSLRAFKEHNASYLCKTVTPDGDIKIVPMVDAWRSSKKTRHYAGYVYRPGAPRFCRRPGAYLDDDYLYVNTFYFPPHPEPVESLDTPSRSIKPLFNFIDRLFVVPSERDWFVNWLARIIQNPGTRSFVTPVNITPVTGTGRGLLYETIQAIVGHHNCHDVSESDLTGKFNAYLGRTLIAVVQEIKSLSGESKYQTWEHIKSLLTDTTASIQLKGVDSYTGPVYANFLMFSNNLDALPLDDVNERRIYAMRGADTPINQDEIDAIKNWREDPKNVAYAFHFLKNLDLTGVDFRRAPVTETKRQMVHASVGVAADVLTGWLEEEAPIVFDLDYLDDALLKFCKDLEDIDLSRPTLRRRLRDKGYHNQRIRNTEGDRVYVWYHPSKIESDTKTLRDKYNNLKIEKAVF